MGKFEDGSWSAGPGGTYRTRVQQLLNANSGMTPDQAYAQALHEARQAASGGPTGSTRVGVTPNQQAQIDASNRNADLQYQVGMAGINAQIAAENNRHAEVMANLQQQALFHADDVRLREQQNAENERHSRALESLQHEATMMQQTLEQMREANAIQLEQMREGNAIQLQQGEQAFQDWQSRQGFRMQMLSSALSNPWLQQLAGMTPPPGQAGAAVGGANISNLISQILQPYNPNAPGGQGGGPEMFQQAGGGTPTPQIVNPSWSQWQGWNPFQRAAYRTNIEALGPGAWQAEQQNVMGQFLAQGGNPNITQMQRAAATPEQQIGQEMTANVFGQTGPQWAAEQQKAWSQAQAPQVRQNLQGIGA